MTKLKLGLAALAAAFTIFSCDGGGSAADILGSEDMGKGPDGKTPVKDIVITFKNGWENASADDNEKKELTLTQVNPVVDTEEMNLYKQQKADYDEIKALWDAYDAAKNGENPPPPPRLISLQNLSLL
ncbi:MAG: hypothetical protein LBH18_06290 [Spirochaetaceae bacterium]|jgi:hypothetical protein|nr:hypothetical protein [Spirochaetaceae bacterium]